MNEGLSRPMHKAKQARPIYALSIVLVNDWTWMAVNERWRLVLNPGTLQLYSSQSLCIWTEQVLDGSGEDLFATDG
jgi:hypothetical protein